jgi:hypothetical protein
MLMLSLAAGCAASPQADTASPNWEYLISSGRWDEGNRYASVVQVATGRGTCSGVLARKSLVFTAAHCLCLPDTLTPKRVYSHGRVTIGRVKLACEEQATVTAVLYTKQATGGADPQHTPGKQTHRGSVQTHPGYEFATDDKGAVVYSVMDLAAIHLEKPFNGIRVDGQLPAQEVQPEEALTAVGYGEASDGSMYRRFFGTNKVMDIHIIVGGDGVFTFRGQDAQGRGAHAMRGDSGGPCFREDAKGNRWLTGIISTGKAVKGMRMSAFTSTFHHRAWLQEQINSNGKSASDR